MSTVVHVDFAAARIMRDALNRAERVRSIVEDLLAIRGVNGATDDEARAVMGCWWVNQGWVSSGDLKLAMQTLEEMR